MKMQPPMFVLSLSLILGAARLALSADISQELDAAAKTAAAELPGTVGILVTELTAHGVKPLFGKHEKERFAVGSSFKLFILGTLAAEVNADRRQFENVMRLKPEWVGPPSSEMGGWPMGSPVTLHTLALKMNAISDNTATDHLLHLLGREAIETQMAVMGHARPEWNRPLLSTREMTSLRDKQQNMPGRDYAKLDDKGKREFLAKKFTGKPDYEALDFDTAAYDISEWYATPLDMAKALDWLKRNSEDGQPANPIRGILAADTKLPHDEKIWPYVGFKGGSEDQLICGNWLLKNGRWYTFHVYCNSPKEKVEPAKFIKAIEQLFAAVQRAVE
jgi:beta-lactamase class A